VGSEDAADWEATAVEELLEEQRKREMRAAESKGETEATDEKFLRRNIFYFLIKMKNHFLIEKKRCSNVEFLFVSLVLTYIKYKVSLGTKNA
jgi:hypothetical protein